MIKLKGVGKKYGDFTALHPADLDFESGKTSVLIGPSGCGKSTLLRLIIKLIEPTWGEVEFQGQKITAENLREIRRQMGYVIQDGGLFPHLTAGQNAALLARHLRKEEEWTRGRLKELCELSHFPLEKLDRYPLELSGGQRQRVSLMRGLMLDPPVLLLDEPMGALDPMVRTSLQKDLKEIFQNLKKTVVMVTHDMGEAAYLGDQIILIRKGEVIQKGTLSEFRENPANPYVTKFINAQRSLVEL